MEDITPGSFSLFYMVQPRVGEFKCAMYFQYFCIAMLG